jgi:hypothetical protein
MSRHAEVLETGSSRSAGGRPALARPRSRGVVLAVLATAQLVIALDYSIVNTPPEVPPRCGRHSRSCRPAAVTR